MNNNNSLEFGLDGKTLFRQLDEEFSDATRSAGESINVHAGRGRTKSKAITALVQSEPEEEESDM